MKILHAKNKFKFARYEDLLQICLQTLVVIHAESFQRLFQKLFLSFLHMDHVAQ